MFYTAPALGAPPLRPAAHERLRTEPLGRTIATDGRSKLCGRALIHGQALPDPVVLPRVDCGVCRSRRRCRRADAAGPAAACGAARAALQRRTAFPGHRIQRHAGRPGARACRSGRDRAAAARHRCGAGAGRTHGLPRRADRRQRHRRRAGGRIESDRAARGRRAARPQQPGAATPGAAVERRRVRAAGSERTARAGVPIGRADGGDARLGEAQRRGLLVGGVGRRAHRHRHRRGAGLSRHRSAHPQHHRLHGRHRQCAPLHQRAAHRGVLEAGGGVEVGPARRRQRRGADAQRRHRRQRRGVRLGRQVPGLALPAGRQAAGGDQQRRRSGGAGGRLGGRDRAGAGPAVGGIGRAAGAAVE